MREKKRSSHDGHRDRVRQRYLRSGLIDFEDHQALELLLFYAVPRRDTNELAHKLLTKFGSFHNLLSADPRKIARMCGISINTAVLISLIVPMYQKFSQSRTEKRMVIDTSLKAGQHAISLMHGRTLECFFLICLDTRKQLIFSEMVSEGTPDETSIYIRHIVEVALKHKAVSIILAHNHPSGLLTASQNDLEATVAIKDALDTINVPVLDHIIVAGDDYLSFSEKRLLGLTY
jgi:DNA repair protein RadC